MDKLMQFIETKVMPPMMKLSNQRHLSAVRDGLIAPTSGISPLAISPQLPTPHRFRFTLKLGGKCRFPV